MTQLVAMTVTLEARRLAMTTYKGQHTNRANTNHERRSLSELRPTMSNSAAGAPPVCSVGQVLQRGSCVCLHHTLAGKKEHNV